MAVKISESEWADITKKVIKDGKLDPKLKLDDAALVKALVAYDRIDGSKREAYLKALDELIKQIAEQVKALIRRKKELGDKPFSQLKDKLYDLLEVAESQRKTAQEVAESKGKGKDDEVDEPDTPALLNTKMVPLLRQLRKGETQMHAVICTAGKNTAVLIMRLPISKSRYPLLAQAVDAKGGMKYIVAECLFDLQSKVLTFVVKSSGAQLAKRVRQALLDQTHLRFMVKVRGEDGVEEQDGKDEGEDQAGVNAQVQKAPPGGPASAEHLAYTQRLAKVKDRYEQALQQRHIESTKLRALMGLASEKADEQQNYAAAIQVLQALEKVLDASASAPSGDVDPGAAFKARLIALIPRLKEAQTAGRPGAQDAKLKASESGVWAGKKDFARARLLLDEVEALLEQPSAAATLAGDSWPQAHEAWLRANEKLDAQLNALRQAILAETDYPELSAKLRKIAEVGLNALTGNQRVKLMGTLRLIGAGDSQSMQKHAAKALAAFAALRSQLDANKKVDACEDNPWGVELTIRDTLYRPLDRMTRVLQSHQARA